MICFGGACASRSRRCTWNVAASSAALGTCKTASGYLSGPSRSAVPCAGSVPDRRQCHHRFFCFKVCCFSAALESKGSEERRTPCGPGRGRVRRRRILTSSRPRTATTTAAARRRRPALRKRLRIHVSWLRKRRNESGAARLTANDIWAEACMSAFRRAPHGSVGPSRFDWPIGSFPATASAGCAVPPGRSTTAGARTIYDTSTRLMHMCVNQGAVRSPCGR